MLPYKHQHVSIVVIAAKGSLYGCRLSVAISLTGGITCSNCTVTNGAPFVQSAFCTNTVIPSLSFQLSFQQFSHTHLYYVSVCSELFMFHEQTVKTFFLSGAQ